MNTQIDLTTQVKGVLPPGNGGAVPAPNAIFWGATSVPVTNLRVIGSAYVLGLGAGTTDLYTVPVGKKALVLEATYTNPQSSGQTITALAQYKSGGVYVSYDFVANASGQGSYGVTALLAPMLLNAGESFSVNCDHAGLSIWPFILEFDAAAPINVARLSSFNVGDNTLLVTPASGMQLFPNLTGISAGNPLKGSLFYFNNSGILRTIGWNLVPSGGGTALANLIATGLAIGSPSISVKTFYGGLNVGDIISINTDSNITGQAAYVLYRTLP